MNIIKIIILLAFIIAGTIYVADSYKSCSESNGKLVRGMIGYECITKEVK